MSEPEPATSQQRVASNARRLRSCERQSHLPALLTSLRHVHSQPCFRPNSTLIPPSISCPTLASLASPVQTFTLKKTPTWACPDSELNQSPHWQKNPCRVPYTLQSVLHRATALRIHLSSGCLIDRAFIECRNTYIACGVAAGCATSAQKISYDPLQ